MVAIDTLLEIYAERTYAAIRDPEARAKLTELADELEAAWQLRPRNDLAYAIGWVCYHFPLPAPQGEARARQWLQLVGRTRSRTRSQRRDRPRRGAARR